MSDIIHLHHDALPQMKSISNDAVKELVLKHNIKEPNDCSNTLIYLEETTISLAKEEHSQKSFEGFFKILI